MSVDARPPSPAAVAADVARALQEDIGTGDATAALLPDVRDTAYLLCKEVAVIAGRPWFDAVHRALHPEVAIAWHIAEGDRVRAGTVIATLEGRARALVTAERAALNFLQTLSGTATITADYVAAVRGTKAKILDTRKTTPGWRLLEKYAVRCGGGTNHRLNLSSAVLIKDNHLAAVDGDVAVAVRRARDLAPAGTKVEVECESVEQVRAALDAAADIIMLDNMSPGQMGECVKLVAGRAITEASGGVNLDTVRRIAETGVDWISVGALTHSAPALDLGLDFE